MLIDSFLVITIGILPVLFLILSGMSIKSLLLQKKNRRKSGCGLRSYNLSSDQCCVRRGVYLRE